MKSVAVAVLVFLAATLVTSPTQARQAAAPSAPHGVYTTVQAGRGKAVYEKKCDMCHGAVDATTPDMAALLSDHVFRKKWTGRSVAELFDYIRETMPQNEPRSLSPEDVAALIAYILSANGFPPGEVDLKPNAEALKEIRWEALLP